MNDIKINPIKIAKVGFGLLTKPFNYQVKLEDLKKNVTVENVYFATFALAAITAAIIHPPTFVILSGAVSITSKLLFMLATLLAAAIALSLPALKGIFSTANALSQAASGLQNNKEGSEVQKIEPTPQEEAKTNSGVEAVSSQNFEGVWNEVTQTQPLSLEKMNQIFDKSQGPSKESAEFINPELEQVWNQVVLQKKDQWDEFLDKYEEAEKTVKTQGFSQAKPKNMGLNDLLSQFEKSSTPSTVEIPSFNKRLMKNLPTDLSVEKLVEDFSVDNMVGDFNTFVQKQATKNRSSISEIALGIGVVAAAAGVFYGLTKDLGDPEEKGLSYVKLNKEQVEQIETANISDNNDFEETFAEIFN